MRLHHRVHEPGLVIDDDHDHDHEHVHEHEHVNEHGSVHEHVNEHVNEHAHVLTPGHWPLTTAFEGAKNV